MTTEDITENVTPNLSEYQAALEKYNQHVGQSSILSARLKDAKIGLQAAINKASAATVAKGKAISIDEVSISARELESALIAKKDSDDLVANIERALKELPNDIHSAWNVAEEAKKIAFLNYSKQLIGQVVNHPAFPVIQRAISKAFVAECAALGDASAGRFIDAAFGGDGTGNFGGNSRATAYRELMLKFGITASHI